MFKESLRSLELEIIEPKDPCTDQAWAYATKVLSKKNSDLPSILAARGAEDVAQAVRDAAGYVLWCYCSRDPNFNLDLIWEEIAVAGPVAEERLQEECQGVMDYVGSIFKVESTKE